ncbi:MAG: hypothetical protein M0R22_10705, partial [Dehalococcoidia bacterium]|nr:hypothetical protein [Dehalococcoidia bacterium]
QASKMPLASHALWLNIQQWGGHQKAIRIAREDSSVRKMWGLPKAFFEQECAERIEDVDLSVFQ